MNGFNCKIHHIDGKSNILPDLLSREKITCTVDRNNLIKKELSLKEKESESLISLIYNKLREPEEFDQDVENEFDLYKKKQKNKINVKKSSLIEKIISTFHTLCGHSGINSSFQTLKYYFNIDNLYYKIIIILGIVTNAINVNKNTQKQILMIRF